MIYTWKSPLNKAFKRIYKWGFILTMWNVNLIHLNFFYKSTASFILTMWNVNRRGKPALSKPTLVLS